LQRAEAWLANKGLTEIDIARDGRRDFRQILAKGVGLCGMAAIALTDYLREKDTTAKILALGGHVVVYASVRGRNYLLDPDYGVTIADVPAPPERSLSQIVAAYRAAGYWPRKVQKLERKYAASEMRLYDLTRFQNGKRRLLARAEFIKWLIPLGLIALGGFLARKPSEVDPSPRPHGSRPAARGHIGPRRVNHRSSRRDSAT
jgi:hypothetical protein